MSVVNSVLLQDCIARPDDADRHFPLIEHLIAVAYGCGRPDGNSEERLGFLAGLSHDAAKTASDWQHYIRNVAVVKKGPPHAPLGAALFAFWSEDLIPRWTSGDRRALRQLYDLALDWTRMVYDHHGTIDDLPLDIAPWTEGTSGSNLVPLLETCDCPGLTALVRRFFPECAADLNEFPVWLENADDRWHRRRRVVRQQLLNELRRERLGQDVPLAPEGLRLPRLGARLIFADRSHAADWDVATFAATDAERAAATLEQYCKEEAERKLKQGASQALVTARGQVQAAALAAFRLQPDALAYTLLLPTGYGKTLGGLRVALEACRSGRCRRLIYVAPYLSILSQAAGDICKATGLEVFVHHHLTAATLEDHQPYDLLETWQTPVMATTFNQLFRALFPRRAQQCLRIPALDGAFLFIDEPQIVDVSVWNLFLRVLAVVARERGCQILLSTATLPPLGDGLDVPAVPLAPTVVPGTETVGRYWIRSLAAPWKPREVARQAQQRFKSAGGVAAILNTVRDAVEVYELANNGDEANWFFLAAMMLSGHKAARIAAIRERLEPGRAGGPLATGVVCTQVLEAGVDLSFRSLLRAVPIFSSVAQAAGRANRHDEGDEPAEVIVFPFLRADDTDSRVFVYRDETARRHTDAILRENPDLPESRVPAVLRDYYERCRQENQATACLQQLEKSAEGEWSALAGLRPFDDGVPELEVFIPGADGYLAQAMRPLMARLAPGGSADLLNRYRDVRFRRSLSFLDRKRVSAVLRQFTVSVPEKLAKRIATQTQECEWLWALNDPKDYSARTGLAHLLSEDDAGPACTIF